MASVRIKICGVTTPEDARHAADCGADAVGLNFYPQSPRFLPASAAMAVVRAFSAKVPALWGSGRLTGAPIPAVLALAAATSADARLSISV